MEDLIFVGGFAFAAFLGYLFMGKLDNYMEEEEAEKRSPSHASSAPASEKKEKKPPFHFLKVCRHKP